jgi:2-keto-4-pentenoate hydratase/2-oxohepta-3-ene-1,7-dioic acid hydratase in catechol pathway
MRFVSFVAQGKARFGVQKDSGLVDLSARFGPIVPDLLTYLTAVSREIAPAVDAGWETDYDLDDVSLLPVIPNPAKVLCVGVNFDDHRKEMGREKAAYPTIFARYADTLTAHKAALVRPRVSTSFDYEGELAVIIGQEARNVPVEKAMSVVAGYSCFNDGSVRDWQRHTTQWTPGKNFPATGALGPSLVMRDDVGDLRPLSLTTRLNGAVMQEATFAQLVFDIPQIIAYVSSFTKLLPGDVIATGTPSGVGSARTPPVWLKAGDTVEVVIANVGHLVNTVADEVV